MTPYREGRAQIKKLDHLIFLGGIILISLWLSFFITTSWLRSYTVKITTTQTETLSEISEVSQTISGITAQLTDIRTVLKMCEKFPPPDPERLKRIDAEIRGNYNNFPNQEEMMKGLMEDGL